MTRRIWKVCVRPRRAISRAPLPALLALTRSGRLHPEVVVTHHLPLSDGAAGYELFHSRTGGVGKVVLDPSA